MRPPVPPIDQLQLVPQLLVERLERQGLFTTGLLLEVSETRTRRQTLADQIGVTTNEINLWRDEALLLNLAGFGPDEQRLFTQAGIVGLADLVALDGETFRDRLHRSAAILGMPVPDEVRIEGWFLQARTLEEE
jgi:hypothetical protein